MAQGADLNSEAMASHCSTASQKINNFLTSWSSSCIREIGGYVNTTLIFPRSIGIHIVETNGFSAACAMDFFSSLNLDHLCRNQPILHRTPKFAHYIPCWFDNFLIHRLKRFRSAVNSGVAVNPSTGTFGNNARSVCCSSIPW